VGYDGIMRALSTLAAVLLLVGACGDDDGGGSPDAPFWWDDAPNPPDGAPIPPDADSPMPDADPTRPDADPAAPDAPAGTPDARVIPPDAPSGTPDAPPSPPDAPPMPTPDAAPGAIDCRDPATWPPAWTMLEDMAVTIINMRRTSGATCSGVALPPVAALTVNARLREAARCHSLDMATNNFFSHTSPTAGSVTNRLVAAGYSFSTWAENIAAGNGTAAATVMQWMNSTAGHCEAIMNGNYQDIGLGYSYSAASTWDHYWTADFGRP